MTRVRFYFTSYETLNIPEFSYGGNLIQFSNDADLTNQLWINNLTPSVYIRAMNASGQSIGTWKQWKRIYPDYSNISLRVNGYIVFNNGLILQWGIIINGQSFSVILPISFSTADWVLSVTGDSRLVVQNGATTTNSFTIAAWVANPTSGMITVNTQATSAHITWLAISY